MMSAAGWFVVLLAVAGANLPFANQRIFAVVPLARPRKTGWFRIAEMIALYMLVGALGFWLEARAGNRFDQGWQFYAITFSLFIVFAFPGFTFQYLVVRRVRSNQGIRGAARLNGRDREDSVSVI